MIRRRLKALSKRARVFWLKNLGFSPWANSSTEPKLTGATLYIRPAQRSDWLAWSSLRAKSRAFLEPWEPLWPADDLTARAFVYRLKLIQEETSRGEGYTFLLFRRADNMLLGGLSLSNIRGGVAQTATLGYWMGEEFAGQGHMREAVNLALDFAFHALRLHRVEAGCLPRNVRSSRLLTRLGFSHEGLARSYLQINGAWEDHLLFAILSTDARR